MFIPTPRGVEETNDAADRIYDHYLQLKEYSVSVSPAGDGVDRNVDLHYVLKLRTSDIQCKGIGCLMTGEDRDIPQMNTKTVLRRRTVFCCPDTQSSVKSPEFVKNAKKYCKRNNFVL